MAVTTTFILSPPGYQATEPTQAGGSRTGFDGDALQLGAPARGRHGTFVLCTERTGGPSARDACSASPTAVRNAMVWLYGPAPARTAAGSLRW